MTPSELRGRAEAFAVRTLRVTAPLLDQITTRDVALQLRRAATSVAQNYAACTIARSHADFIAKLRLALEEADESARWIRMLRDANLADGVDIEWLRSEATQLARILGASCITATRNAALHARRGGKAPAATPRNPSPGKGPLTRK
jgi:four helix bundle protein